MKIRRQVIQTSCLRTLFCVTPKDTRVQKGNCEASAASFFRVRLKNSNGIVLALNLASITFFDLCLDSFSILTSCHLFTLVWSKVYDDEFALFYDNDDRFLFCGRLYRDVKYAARFRGVWVGIAHLSPRMPAKRISFLYYSQMISRLLKWRIYFSWKKSRYFKSLPSTRREVRW